MVRLIAFILVLVGLGVVYEEFTGKPVGVKSTIGKIAGVPGYLYDLATPSPGGSKRTLADWADGN